jgi:ribonuclease HI
LTVTVYSDASFASPHAGLAAVIEFGGECSIISRWARCRGNNQAEYMAAIMGARMASSWFPAEEIVVITDSELLFKQFNGRAKARSRPLVAMRAKLSSMVVEVQFQPRHQMVLTADKFAKMAMSQGKKHAT